jgi:hypothetical protein
LNWVCQQQFDGTDAARLPGKKLTTLFHSTHPGLATALRAATRKAKSAASIRRTSRSTKRVGRSTGNGGHFRAALEFRYVGRGQRQKPGIPAAGTGSAKG